MKIVVLGADGQLACDLCHSFADHSVVALGRGELDILDQQATGETLRGLRPAAIINAAAYNRVDDAEEQVAAAFSANAFAVLGLARHCADLKCLLVHFSTDYVFGRSPTRRPWTESDLPAPLNVYGASKLAGENLVRAYCDRHFIIRTSGLFGFRRSGAAGGNFVEAILRAAQRTGRLRVVNDQTCGPSYTADVADATARLLETQAFGTYHITNSGECTWYDFAAEILRQSGQAAECTAISTAEYAAQANRPRYSVLSNARLVAARVPRLPPWQDGLARYLSRRRG